MGKYFRKNRCAGKSVADGHKCRNKISHIGNTNELPYCYIHLTQYRKQLARANELLNEVMRAYPLASCCCVCRSPCNPASQTCGRCARNLTMYGAHAYEMVRR